METGKLEIEKLFVGERLSLDFINTNCRRREEELEFLGTVEDAQKWLRFAEGVHHLELYNSEAWINERGEKLLARALGLRMALRDLVLATIEKRPAPSSAIDTVNALLQTNPTYKQMALTPDGLSESIYTDDMDNLWLITIAIDALDLLCHSDLSLLRQCEHPTCVRVFYDTTKNHRRRWCVEKCGTHSKAATYYRRKVARIRQEATQGEVKQ